MPLRFNTNLISRILFLVCFFGFGSNAFGQIAPAVPKGVEGYTVSIRDVWVASELGFRPIRVTIETNPAKATVEDEEFSIEVVSVQYDNSSQVTTASLVIPSGQKSGTAELYVHDLFAVNARHCNIVVRDSNGREVVREPGWSPTAVNGLPSMLVVSDEFPEIAVDQKVCYEGMAKPVAQPISTYTSKKPLPSFDQMAILYGLGEAFNTPSGMAFLGGGQPVTVPAGKGAAPKMTPFDGMTVNPRIHFARQNELPFSWVGLEGVEQILIPLDEFKKLSESNERQRANIEKWIVTGGILIVYETGPDFKNAETVWPLMLGSERQRLAKRVDPKWNTPTPALRKLKKLSHGNGYENYGYYNMDQTMWYDTGEVSANIGQRKTFDRLDEIPETEKFAVSDYVNGRIVVVNDMSKWNRSDWRLLHNTLATRGASISQRVGVVYNEGYNENFSIPGVGEPPVKTFQILLTLFLLIAGPVMLLFLKRTQQMQYLFVAVPILSLVVCTSLFAYAIIVDGSGQWGRTNSVTLLDHRTNMGVTHTRSSYYSGVHPGSYELPVDQLGVPISRNENRSYERSYVDGKMVISGGDIDTRTPHKVLTTQPINASERLVVIESESEPDSAPPKVKNLLGAEVGCAVIQTESGFYIVQDLADGETVQATEILVDSASGFASKLAQEWSPQIVGFLANSRRTYYYSSDTGYRGSIGEEYRTVERIRASELESMLEKNSYIAILKEFPLALEQTEQVQYRMQMHVVRGQW